MGRVVALLGLDVYGEDWQLKHEYRMGFGDIYLTLASIARGERIRSECVSATRSFWPPWG